jgi:hypothetical protein
MFVVIVYYQQKLLLFDPYKSFISFWESTILEENQTGEPTLGAGYW